jgi:aryl-alcohol dehydrogenase-like predicted oxidoreductase
MPTCWDAFFLEKSIDASLRRLNRPRIEVFMLHSPTVDVMNRGKAMDTLERVRQKGKIGIVGVAVDDVATAEAALKDARVRVMQLPMLPGDDSFDAVVGLAAQNGVAVVAREILGGGRAISGAVDPACYAEKRITELVRMPEITVPLVGTTREAHLVVAANAARAAMGASR